MYTSTILRKCGIWKSRWLPEARMPFPKPPWWTPSTGEQASPGWQHTHPSGWFEVSTQRERNRCAASTIWLLILANDSLPHLQQHRRAAAPSSCCWGREADWSRTERNWTNRWPKQSRMIAHFPAIEERNRGRRSGRRRKTWQRKRSCSCCAQKDPLDKLTLACRDYCLSIRRAMCWTSGWEDAEWIRLPRMGRRYCKRENPQALQSSRQWNCSWANGENMMM